jgi:lipoprotein NlpI
MKVSWILCLVPLLAAPAFGQNGWNADAQTCQDQSGDPAIDACTRAIASGQLSQTNLAETYMNRGVEWRHKGDNDRAMADYDEAIRLNPNDAMTYNDRANIWADKGDLSHAIADYDQAIRLNPNYAKAYSNRGVANYYSRNWAASAADFARAHDLNSKDVYAMLWQALAGMRQPDSGWAARLEAQSQGLSQDWPWPLVRFYTGQIDADQVLAAVGGTDSGQQQDRICEAGFYLGEWKLVHGQAREAAEYLEKAQLNCPHSYSEYETAVRELKNLGSQ